MNELNPTEDLDCFSCPGYEDDAVKNSLSQIEALNDKVTSPQANFSWNPIPHVALVKIFGYLNEYERLNVQFVCRRWYDIIRHSGCLWRSKCFRFSGRDSRNLSQESHKFATNFVRTFGRYIQKLEFRLYSPLSMSVCRKFKKTVKVSFNHLIRTKCKLVELSLPALQLDRGQWVLFREDICNALARYFCQGEKTIRRLFLRGARTNFDDGYKVLYALSYNTGVTITHLDIEDFFNGLRPVFQLNQFTDCFRNFSNLQELDINYSYVSENLLDTMATNLRYNSFKHLYIKVTAHETRDQTIRGCCWQYLHDQCPNLEVHIFMQRVMTFVDHFRILSPEIPLVEASFDGCYFADRDWQICPTISTLLPQYKNSLRKLYFDVPDTRESIENELLALVQQCTKLQNLKINAFVSTRFLKKLMQMRKENIIKFKNLKMRIYVHDYDTSIEDREVDIIYEEFRQLITSVLEDYYVICCVSI